MEQQQLDRAALDTWAIVEMFGHKRIAGKISEHVLGSAVLVRVDVPELVSPRRGPHDECVHTPAFTKLLGPSSIYCLTPCSEEVARKAAQEFVRWDPPIPVAFQPQLPASTSGPVVLEEVEHDDDDDEFDDFGVADDDEEIDMSEIPDGEVGRPHSPDTEASLPL